MNAFVKPATEANRSRRRLKFFGRSSGTRYLPSALLAIALHAGLVFGWRGSFGFEPAEYGVVHGESTIEVVLVAAPPGAPATEESTQAEEVTASPQSVEPHQVIPEVQEPEPVPAPSLVETPSLKPVRELSTLPDTIKATPEPARSPITASKQKTVKARPERPKVGRASGGREGDTAGARSAPGSQASKPAYLHNPHPLYPEAARRAGHAGVVMLRVSINERGSVSAVRLIKSSGHPVLDERARTTVARWIFRPARQNGKPVDTQVDVPVRFRLDR